MLYTLLLDAYVAILTDYHFILKRAILGQTFLGWHFCLYAKLIFKVYIN